MYQLVPGSTSEDNRLDTIELKFRHQGETENGDDARGTRNKYVGHFARKGWLILDLTTALNAWQLDYKSNQVVLLSFKVICSASLILELLPKMISGRVSGDLQEEFRGPAEAG